MVGCSVGESAFTRYAKLWSSAFMVRIGRVLVLWSSIFIPGASIINLPSVRKKVNKSAEMMLIDLVRCWEPAIVQVVKISKQGTIP